MAVHGDPLDPSVVHPVQDQASEEGAMMNWLKKRQARRRCPHSHLRPIYGDEILMAKSRLCCVDCNTLLDGSVHIAELRKNETELVKEWQHANRT